MLLYIDCRVCFLRVVPFASYACIIYVRCMGTLVRARRAPLPIGFYARVPFPVAFSDVGICIVGVAGASLK